MRLIDADALIAYIKKRLKNEMVIAWLCRIIGEVPTIEAEPVRHGRWDYYSSTMQECSVCKRHTPRHRYTFCPNCGAKMDGGADDATD